jgi:hypothetical protein
MAHKQQAGFCQYVKERFPLYFKHSNVLDVGSLDINGNNKYLFEDCNYFGIDRIEGKNVDLALSVSKYYQSHTWICYNTIICNEVFEHDPEFEDSIKAIVRLLKPGGLFLMSCATANRAVHNTEPGGFYKNRFKEDFLAIEEFREAFGVFEWKENRCPDDLYFWGIKTGNSIKKPIVESIKPNLKIAIALPSLGEIKTVTTVDLMRLHTQMTIDGMNPQILYAFGNVDASRNMLVNAAQELNCSHILFADSDAGFPPGYVAKHLLAEDKDIIGVNAAMKRSGNPVRTHDVNGKELDYIRDEIAEVDTLGMHLCLIKMSVFERMTKPYFWCDRIVDRGEVAGEDITFCKAARQFYGFKIFCHLRLSMEIGHVLWQDQILYLEPHIRKQIEAWKAKNGY